MKQPERVQGEGLGAGAGSMRVARVPGNRTRTWSENENASAVLGAK